ncbi:MAG: Dihydroorotate dehydrogenase (NAD(+)), catalytic subunit, partial [uncultured Acidimicrobiales bacterium]
DRPGRPVQERRPVDVGRDGALPQPGDDRVGNGRARGGAGPLHGPVVPRGGGREVALGRGVGGQSRAAGDRGRRRHAQQRRAAEPGGGGVDGGGAPGPAGDGRASGGQHLGVHRRGLREGGHRPGRRAARSGGGGGQPELPQPPWRRPHRGEPPGDVRPLGRVDRRRDGGDGGLPATAVGQAQSQRHRHHRDRRCRPGGGSGSPHAGQHGDGHGHRRGDPPLPPRRRWRGALRTGHPAGGGAGRARRVLRVSRCGGGRGGRGGHRRARGGAAPGRRVGGAGRHRHLRRPSGAGPDTCGIGAVVPPSWRRPPRRSGREGPCRHV